MNRSLRALMCAALTVCMVLTLFVLPAAAENDVIDSGNCGKSGGDNLTYKLTKLTNEEGNDEYTLTISGTGEMATYTVGDPAPWSTQKANITTIVIKNGVTSIGALAFYECQILTTVTIPKSVTEIGDSAFTKCNNIKTVNYSGTEDEWTTLAADDDETGAGPGFTENITVNYNYQPDDDDPSDDSTAFATIDSVSLSLNGTLDLNFYVTTANVDDISATFKRDDASITPAGDPDSKNGQYVYTYSVAAKDMDTPITLTLSNEDGTDEVSCEYSVNKYIESARKVHSSNKNLTDLFNATSDYGAWAKYFFVSAEEGQDAPTYTGGELSEAFNDPSTAADDVKNALSGLKPTTDGNSEYLELSRVSLELKSSTSMWLYFLPKGEHNAEDLLKLDFSGSFNCGAPAVVTEEDEETGESKEYVCVSVNGITATDLDTVFTVTVKDSDEGSVNVKCNALSYVQGVLQNKEDGSEPSSLQSLVTALYLYNQAADAYFGA